MVGVGVGGVLGSKVVGELVVGDQVGERDGGKVPTCPGPVGVVVLVLDSVGGEVGLFHVVDVVGDAVVLVGNGPGELGSRVVRDLVGGKVSITNVGDGGLVGDEVVVVLVGELVDGEGVVDFCHPDVGRLVVAYPFSQTSELILKLVTLYDMILPFLTSNCSVSQVRY